MINKYKYYFLQGHKITITTLLCAVLTCQGQAQGEFVVQINPETGEIVKTGLPINGVEYVYPDDRALDENSGTFFFPSALPTQNIFQIKLADGNIVSSPPNNNLTSFQFDNSTGKFYGLNRDVVADTKFLVEINPSTGVATLIGTTQLQGAAIFSGGFSTFDETNHRFIFLGPPDILYTLDASDGAVLFSPNLTLGESEFVVNFAYANTSNRLYALIKNNNLQKFYMATIDLETGVSTLLGDGFFMADGDGSSTIDEANGKYYYLYYSSVVSKYFIASASLSTGDFLHSAALPKDDANDNFFSLKFNRIDKKLYSIHWDEVIVSGLSDEHLMENQVVVFPNPMMDYAMLCFKRPLLDARLVIQNQIGQVVKKVEAFSGETLEIFRVGLPSGLYYFQIFEKTDLLFTGNILVN